MIAFLKDFIYLFLERGERREEERETDIKAREEYQCVVASHTPVNWGPGLQPRHVP